MANLYLFAERAAGSFVALLQGETFTPIAYREVEKAVSPTIVVAIGEHISDICPRCYSEILQPRLLAGEFSSCISCLGL